MFEDMEYMDEVRFFHEESADRHKKTRKSAALKWKSDRKVPGKYKNIDTGFCKKLLHKRNRKNPVLTSKTYYKSDYALGAILIAY